MLKSYWCFKLKSVKLILSQESIDDLISKLNRDSIFILQTKRNNKIKGLNSLIGETFKSSFSEKSLMKPVRRFESSMLTTSNDLDIEKITKTISDFYNEQSESIDREFIAKGSVIKKKLDKLEQVFIAQQKEQFNKALQLKNEEQIPKDKLAEIETILAEQLSKDKEYTGGRRRGRKVAPVGYGGR